jgi:hypothetical protein
MSIFINNSAVTLFDTQVKKVYQEGYSLRGLVREKSVKGAKEIQFPVMGRAIARTKSIHTDVVPSNVAHDPVTAVMQEWYASDYTDIFKNKQINFDEVTELADILKMACGRRADKILIDAMNAASGTGTVGISVGGSNTDMNFDKFIEAMGALDDAGVPEEGRTILMNHRAYRSLLGDEKFTSSDYGQMRFDGTSQGNKKGFVGFDIVTINERVEEDGSRLGLPLSTNDVTLFAFHRDAIGMGFNMEVTSETNYVPQKLHFLSTVMFSAGAKAIDPKGIVKITVRQTQA